jgi:hypothetical protein
MMTNKLECLAGKEIYQLVTDKADWRQHNMLFSLYIHLKKNQLDAQLIFSIFRQTPLRVSGISIAHHQEIHLTDTTVGTYCSL